MESLLPKTLNAAKKKEKALTTTAFQSMDFKDADMVQNNTHLTFHADLSRKSVTSELNNLPLNTATVRKSRQIASI